MSGYSKLFSSIVTSSVWTESHTTRIVWISLLATCNAEGVVEGSIPGFARLAGVTVDEMIEAIRILSSPDKFSRSKDHEGRRIEEIPGGWRILNYESYRNKLQSTPGAVRQRRFRVKERNKENAVSTEDRVQKTEDSRTLRSVTRNASTLQFPDELNTPDFKQLWLEWCRFRKELGKSLTPTSIRRQIAQLSQVTPDVARQMLEQSMTNGWQGLFPPTVQTKQNKPLKNYQA